MGRERRWCMSKWTLFSNHGHVLVVLSRDPDARLRDVAQIVGITERAVQKIVRDLQDNGYITITKQGRCNRYRINRRKTLRHSLQSHITVGKLLTLITGSPSQSPQAVAQEAELPDPVQATAAPKEPPQATVAPAEPEVVETAGEARPPEDETAPAKPAATRKEKKSSRPPDTRQQGSLF